ncbi:hypothetical protein NL676_033683 [Syzygium grande]|nr:hypothetical protein NL676_033683 [Syzygium grande]
MATEEVVVESAGAGVDRHAVSAPRLALIATGGGGESDAIAVEQHAEDGGLCDAVVAPLLQSRSESLNEVDDEDDDVRVLDHIPTETRPSSSRKRKKKPYSGSSVTETGQPSNSKPDPSLICEVCAVPRTKKDLFRITGCSHACCNDCAATYVASKLRDNVTRIGCPVSGCRGVLEPGYCSSILPPEVFDRWDNALCEALILEAERFYCPFTDCSALLIDEGGAVVRESECPSCRRLFCAQCRVPWHAGLKCREFRALNEGENGSEDIMLLKVAPASFSGKRKCKKEPHSVSLVTGTDQLPNSKPDPSFVCEICIEPRMSSDMFRIRGCSHAYCNECVTKYVTSKLGDNVTRVGCPILGCGGVLELEHCSSILPPEVFDRWGKALCEALILEGERFYCPFRDCSALLMNDGGAAVRESECPNCRRLFCAQCRVPWHAGIECQQFQRLKEGREGGRT